MIEVAIRNYLVNELKDVPVYMEYPQTPESKFVVLRLADGGRINLIDAATFFVTVYADTLYEAADLKEIVKTAMFDACTLPAISKSTIGQEQAGTDSANHKFTYNLTFNFYYYREETKK